jgi:acetoin utilization deacetylase AcuC-like enzyme
LFVYCDKFDLDWKNHIFPINKYSLVVERILRTGIAKPQDILTPEPAGEEDLLLVHTPEYLNQLRHLTKVPGRALFRFEAPMTERTLASAIYSTGGSILACREALTRGAAMNIGGGFHHAFPDRGEGFCFINDVAVALKVMLRDGLIQRAVVVDCDLHQGNGTARIFRDGDEVFTFSIHQERLYPVPKEKSDLDVGLPNHVDDETYLALLEENLSRILDDHSFDLIFYVAGADPYEKDQLGSLKITKEGLGKRDALVFREAERHNIPVAVALAGGYSENIEDVVEIHANTCQRVKDSLTHRS